MQIVSLIMIVIGSIIMLYSIIKFNGLLDTCRRSVYQKRRRQMFFYIACYIMMCFFLLAYIATFVLAFHIKEANSFIMVIGTVFMFGSLFVFIMVNVQMESSITLNQKSMEVMTTLVNAIEMKDLYTKGHSHHVYSIVELFYDYLPHSYHKRLQRAKLLDAALLHDIGKISIPDAVLNKPGKLNEEEWEMIRTHPLNGKKILDDTSFKEISDWVFFHHERVDGKGYNSLAGEDIPLESRIIAIADTFSALVTNRIYRKKFEYERAIEIMREGAGTQFDAELIDYFCEIDEDELEEILEQHTV